VPDILWLVVHSDACGEPELPRCSWCCHHGSDASLIDIITSCSMISRVASIVFFFGLFNVHSHPRLMAVRHVVCLRGKDHNYLERFTLAMKGASHVDARSVERNREWRALQSRTVSLKWSASRAFTLCLHGSRIALFSAALAVQIFGQRKVPLSRPLTSNVSLRCCLWLWARGRCGCSRNDDVDDVDASTEKYPPLTGSHCDV
jgi:hypothetical protein